MIVTGRLWGTVGVRVGVGTVEDDVVIVMIEFELTTTLTSIVALITVEDASGK